MFALPRNAALSSCLFLFSVFQTSLKAVELPPETAVQVDVDGREGKIGIDVGEASPGKAVNPPWFGENAQYVVTGMFPISNVWKMASMTVSPTKTGDVTLRIYGPHVTEGGTEAKPIYCDFDDIKVDDGSGSSLIQNGSFEESDTAGPIGWKTSGRFSPPASVQSGDAQEGKMFAHVWHNSDYTQTFHVVQGNPITITFYYRLSPSQ